MLDSLAMEVVLNGVLKLLMGQMLVHIEILRGDFRPWLFHLGEEWKDRTVRCLVEGR